MSVAKELRAQKRAVRRGDLPPAALIEAVQDATQKHAGHVKRSALYDVVKAELDGTWGAWDVFAAMQYLDLLAHPDKCWAFYHSKRGQKYYSPSMTLEQAAWGSALRLAAYVKNRR